VLAVFLPVVAGLGGNAGTQSLTVITRGIALGHLEEGGIKRILAKEVSLGLLNGVIIGILVGIIAYFWKGSPEVGLEIGVVLFIAMCVTLAFACFLGTLVPLALKKFGVDPAIASGVIVTAFTDIVGFMTFLGLASFLFQSKMISLFLATL
ncbi:magnesium transporter, partial [archaeon]|nr:magnesium transporter [archaeon]